MARRKYDPGRDFACVILPKLGITPGEDFHALRSEQVDGLLRVAHLLKYRKPKNANGSRARSFYERLSRQCR